MTIFHCWCSFNTSLLSPGSSSFLPFLSSNSLFFYSPLQNFLSLFHFVSLVMHSMTQSQSHMTVNLFTRSKMCCLWDLKHSEMLLRLSLSKKLCLSQEDYAYFFPFTCFCLLGLIPSIASMIDLHFPFSFPCSFILYHFRVSLISLHKSCLLLGMRSTKWIPSDVSWSECSCFPLIQRLIFSYSTPFHFFLMENSSNVSSKARQG